MRRSRSSGGRWSQLAESASWTAPWGRTGSTAPPPGVRSVGSNGVDEHLPELPDRSSPAALDLEDEEAILRAAAEIRQRRVGEQIPGVQEQRRASRPVATRRKRGARVVCGDCLDLIPTLKDGSVGLVVTSPPYAEQRSGHYQGVPRTPTGVHRRLDGALRDKPPQRLRPDRRPPPPPREGVLSDYVLRTRLALREHGWKECEELIWLKPNSPASGQQARDPGGRGRAVLWFQQVVAALLRPQGVRQGVRPAGLRRLAPASRPTASANSPTQPAVRVGRHGEWHRSGHRT